MTHRKPLHPYEQSMLLVAMLFDNKNLVDLLKLLPDEQFERMNVAKEKFLSLPRNERITQIVLELRRLLLVDEYRLNWIHQSWIDDALAKEPLYLRTIIRESINCRVDKNKESDAFEPLPLIFGAFVSQLTKIPEKTAMYDPVLVRLYSLTDDAQRETIASIGHFSISALNEHLATNRLKNYLKKKGMTDFMTNSQSGASKNPFSIDKFRRFLLSHLIKFTKEQTISCEVFAGLIVIALYLSGHKPQWQRAISLGLHVDFGKLIERTIVFINPLDIKKHEHAQLSSFLNASLDRVTK